MDCKKLIPLTIFFFTVSSFALVDYSDVITNDNKDTPNSASPPNAATASKKMSSTIDASKGMPVARSQSLLSLDLNWDTTEITLPTKNAKVNRGILTGHMQTPYNIYLDFQYWYGTTEDQRLAANNRWQAGNPSVKLGLNWLRFGQAQDMATVDFFLGGMVKGPTNSVFAATRSDLFFGGETTKQFQEFIFGLNYEMRLVGRPSRADEGEIGNVQKVATVLAWRAAPNIRFSVEGAGYRMAPKAGSVSNTWSGKHAWSYIAPQLDLALGSSLNVAMGALFPLKSVEVNPELLQGRLWDFKGAYGSSIYAGLNYSL